MKFARRHITVLLAVLVAAVVACGAGAAFATANEAVPENPCATVDDSASAVAWTGAGWAAPVDQQSRTRSAVTDDSTITAELPPDPTDAYQPPDLALDEDEKKAEGDGQEVVSEDETAEQTSDDADQVGEGGDAERSDADTGDVEDQAPRAEGEDEEDEEDERDDPNVGSDSDSDDSSEGEGEQDPPPADESDPDDDESDEGVDPDPEPAQEPGTQPDEELAYPTISTNLEDGQVIDADSYDLVVQAADGAGDVLGADAQTVTYSTDGGADAKLRAAGDDGYEVTYRLPIEGDVAVSITATDADGLQSMLVLTVYRAEKADEAAGSVTISVEATTVGLGTLFGPEEVEFQKDEKMSSVIVRALEEAGFGVVHKGSVERSFYLQHITKKGISNGCEIPEALLERLDEVGEKIGGYHEDSLGEGDFTGQSGWMYAVNGAVMSSNLSSYEPADGDEVRLRFTLYHGSDIGGDDPPYWDEEW